VDGNDTGAISTSTGFISEEFVIIRGEAQLKRSTSWSTTTQRDGSTVITTAEAPNVTEYRLDQWGRVLTGQSLNRSTSNDLDADGNIVSTTQTESTDTLVSILGEAKPLSTATSSRTVLLKTDGTPLGSQVGSPTGSTSTQNLQINYQYDLNTGRILGGTGQGTTWSEDSFGDISEGTISQTYGVAANQAKLMSSYSVTDTENTDFTYTHQEITVTYAYYANGFVKSATGSGFVLSDDGSGDVSDGEITQSYSVINGEAKLSANETVTQSSSGDGSTSSQDITVFYGYNDLGHLVLTRNGQVVTYGSGTSDSTDANGNITHSTINQTYEIILDQARQLTNSTVSDTYDVDGVKTHQNLLVTYVNDEQTGLVQSATGNGDWITTDVDGYQQHGTVTQTYAVFAGQAKLVLQESLADGVTYTTDVNGNILNFNNVPPHAHEDSVTRNEYDANGQLLFSVSVSQQRMADGEVTWQDQTAQYTIAQDGDVKGQRTAGHIESVTIRLGTDGTQLSRTDSDDEETYAALDYLTFTNQWVKRTRRTETEVRSTTVNSDGSDSYSEIQTYYAYDSKANVVEQNAQGQRTYGVGFSISHSG